ncbi:MAG: ATP-binding protein [Burkholderiales bacterium]|nr:ATP-binding protein [Burkholderiales bacterium]
MSIFRRPALAATMARQLLEPSVLDEGLRSGLFLSGLRRTGKTTFLINDLIPALKAGGALVIYVDLWSDVNASPAALVHAAIRTTLTDLQSPGSALWIALKTVRGAKLEGFGVKFGFDLDRIGGAGGVTLAQALTQTVDQAGTDLVLIVDEVQHAIASEDGNQLLLSLKAARDAINTRPGTPGHFILIGTGSHRALVNELTARRNQAFAGATSVPYPVLDGDYVEHLLQRLADEGAGPLPSGATALAAFRTLGHRPEELIKALRLLQAQLPPGASPEAHLPVIAATLRSTAADAELMKVEQLGGLATAVFERIAASDDNARRLFSTEAAAAYSEETGRTVRVDEIQPAINELLAANLIMRRGHGLYAVTDPFVQEIWREKQAWVRKPE